MLDKKRKRICLIWGLILFFLLLISVIVFSLSGNDKFMGMKIVSEKELQRIIDAKPVVQIANTDDWIRFNGNQIPYDCVTNIFYVSQNINKISWEGEFTSVDKNSRLVVVCEDTINQKQEAIKKGHLFHIYLEKEDYCVESQVVFSGLPILNVETDYSLLYNPYDSEVHNYSIKKTCSNYHINNSENYTIKMLDEETEENNAVSYLNLGKNDEWKLLPQKRDNSALRSSIAMELWNRIAIEQENEYCFEIRSDYVEVLVDKQYSGLFLLMQPQEPKEIELREKDYLYQCKESLLDNNIEALIAQGEIEIEGKKNEVTMSDWEPLFLENNNIDVENYINFFLYNQLVYDAEGMNRKKYLLAQYVENQENYKYYRIPSKFIDTFGSLSSKYPYYAEDLQGEIWQRILEDWELEKEQIDKDLINKRWQQLKENGLTMESVISDAVNKEEYLDKSGVFVRNSEYNERYCEEVIEFIEERFKIMDKIYG